MPKIHNGWFFLLLIFIGWFLAEFCFVQIYEIEKNNQDEIGSIKHSLLSSFHFLGLGLIMAGLMKAYGIALEELKKRKCETCFK